MDGATPAAARTREMSLPLGIMATLRKIEVTNRRTWRQRINRFFKVLGTEAHKGDPEAAARVPQFPDSDDGVLNSIVLEKKAELLGMTVSDAAINNFINNISGGQLDQEALNAALAQSDSDNRSSVNQRSVDLFENLRFELLAKNFEALLLSDSTDYGTPEQRWDYFSRLYRAATVQVMPVPVSDFVSKVPAPSNDELESMFNEYKEQLKQPGSPLPGFMVPAQAKFQYFKAVQANFVKAAEAKVTDKEINEYYDSHKESYRKSAFDESEFPAPEKKTPEATKSGSKAMPAAGEKSKTPDSAKSPVSNPPAKTPVAPKSGETSKPADKPKTGPAAPQAPASGKSSDARPGRRHFAAGELLALADTTPPESTPPKTAPGTAKAAKPDAIKSEPAKIHPPKVEPPKAGPNLASPKTNTAKADDVTADEFRPVTDPKVRSAIRTLLASQKAANDITDAFGKLRTSAEMYGRLRMVWVGDGSQGDAPTPPDFNALAKTNGLLFGETPLMSADDAQDVSELGKSLIINMATDSAAYFPSESYDPNIAAYIPQESVGIDESAQTNARFLWWRTEFNKAYVPNFADVKPKVLQTWKMVQARTLAMNAAKKDADDANKRRATLKQMFQDRPNMNVSEIGPFHWLKVDNVSMGTTTQPRISLTNISGVDMAGDDFMRAVFKTDVGSAAAAFNLPETVAYVIQVQKLEPSEDMCRRQFLLYQEQAANSPNLGPADLAARQSSSTVIRAKFQAVCNELGFKRLATAATESQSSGQQESSDDGSDD